MIQAAQNSVPSEETPWPGMGKGRDGAVPRKFVPVPLVPQTSVPVPRGAKAPGHI